MRLRSMLRKNNEPKLARTKRTVGRSVEDLRRKRRHKWRHRTSQKVKWPPIVPLSKNSIKKCSLKNWKQKLISPKIKSDCKVSKLRKIDVCKYCGAKFGSKTGGLLYHYDFAHFGWRYKCKLCPKKNEAIFKSRRGVTYHLKRNHNNQTDNDDPTETQWCYVRYEKLADQNWAQYMQTKRKHHLLKVEKSVTRENINYQEIFQQDPETTSLESSLQSVVEKACKIFCCPCCQYVGDSPVDLAKHLHNSKTCANCLHVNLGDRISVDSSPVEFTEIRVKSEFEEGCSVPNEIFLQEKEVPENLFANSIQTIMTEAVKRIAVKTLYCHCCKYVCNSMIELAEHLTTSMKCANCLQVDLDEKVTLDTSPSQLQQICIKLEIEELEKELESKVAASSAIKTNEQLRSSTLLDQGFFYVLHFRDVEETKDRPDPVSTNLSPNGVQVPMFKKVLSLEIDMYKEL